MSRATMAQKQRTLACTALDNPSHRFTNLYSLMHWRPWIEEAAKRVLARPGSSTAGVDGTTRDAFRKQFDAEITHIVRLLKTKTYQPLPVRRVFIPKRNGKTRPLGIPALRDRIIQEALRAILDPIYEADFRPHSYGFRKERCTMDAIAVLLPLFNGRAKHFYVIEGDLQSYFDTVHHRKLFSLLKRRLADRDLLTLIWKFLKAGVMHHGLFTRTDAGVPQGGVISPLLANVYLHEFDRWAEARWAVDRRTRERTRYAGRGHYTMVRFADDFVVVSNDTHAGVKQTMQEIAAFLASHLHLTLSPDKTVITHVNDGFDFLGFHIRRCRPGGRWVVHLRPTAQNTARVKATIKTLTKRGWTWLDEVTRLHSLNAIVRGWARYYQHTSLLRDLEAISRYTWHRYLRWLLKKHKGSRPQALIRQKTRMIHGRTRWTAMLQEGGHTLSVHQWLPTRPELVRTRYRNKGVGGFSHPYLGDGALADGDNLMGEVGPPRHLDVVRVGVPSGRRGHRAPLDIHERMLRVKVRDGFTCQRCGARDRLHTHHRQGTTTHRLKSLITLCEECHKAAHGIGHVPCPPA
jgi:RNA-directed DNA polymerase